MKSPRTVHSLVIGAGPSGLSAAYELARAGLQPLVVEGGTAVGGQVRGVRHGDFVLDMGRKELYTRIPEVEQLWDEILGGDLAPYDHRVGSMYDGRILELSTEYRGVTRGVPVAGLLNGVAQLLYARVASRRSPANLEEYWYRKTGKRFAEMFAQGYWEKLRGTKWADMPAPQSQDGHRTSVQRLKETFSLFTSGRPYRQHAWRHPKYGVGQLCESLARAVRASGGEFLFGSRVVEIIRRDGVANGIRVKTPEGAETIDASFVVSSLEIDALLHLLAADPEESTGPRRRQEDVLRGVVLVYLFLDEAPRFPHAWLEVNDPGLLAGRITNYSGFNGEMVPPGKTCLCVEFFREQRPGHADLPDADFREAALAECARYNLIDPAKCFDSLVIRMPRSHAALTWRHWDAPEGRRLLDQLRRFPNVFHVNRGGIDRACHAGIEAAKAIISGSRERFDVAAHPARTFLDDSPSVIVRKGAAVPSTV